MKPWDGSLRWPASRGYVFADRSDDGAQAAEVEARMDLAGLVARWGDGHGRRGQDRLLWLWRLAHGEMAADLAEDVGLTKGYVQMQAAHAAELLSRLTIESDEQARYEAAFQRWRRERDAPRAEWPRPPVDRRWWGGR